MRRILEFLISPTYFYADFRKRSIRSQGKGAIAALIRKYNKRNLGISVLLAFVLSVIFQWNEYGNQYSKTYAVMTGVIIWLFPLSRVNEIFYAFLRDAIQKIDGEPAHSDLRFAERIVLALRSYGELVLDFAIIFYMLPATWFNVPMESFWQAAYFSGATITTLGYGDIVPTHFFPGLLTIYEVVCGFTLLIVSFGIYAGRGLAVDK